MESSEDCYEKNEVTRDLDFRGVQEYTLGVVYEGILPHQSQCPSELDASFLSPRPVAKLNSEHSEISG